MADLDSQAAQIRVQATQLREEWTAALPTLEASPTVYQPYLATASLGQVTEAIETVLYWLDRTRAPRGFAPTFHLARSVAATSLGGAITAVQAIRRGEYPFFVNLMVAVNQMAAALNSMLAFGDRTGTREAVAELGGRLAESLALVDTAQAELSKKVQALASADDQASVIAAAAAEAPTLLSTSRSHLAQINEQAANANAQVAAIASASEAIRKTTAEAQSLLEENKSLLLALNAQKASLDEMHARSQKQQELITALLPKGASAGLASSFALRVSQVEGIKRLWVGVFISSLLVLGVLGYLSHAELASLAAGDVGVYLLRRLPIAGPLIWLGWFSAIQYGNTLRIQEDYAFKEATSKAFEGYREHLQHLASVQLSEGNTAMTLLAARTIEVLSHEPTRVFGKSYKDASPTSSLVELMALKPPAR